MTRLRADVFGQGPDLLMLHGWGMHSGVWGEFAERLARDFRVTTVDLPGHGLSPMLDDVSLDGWAHAVLDVAPPRAHWLGWSLGAQIALQAASMQPERVQRLLMFSGNPCFVARPDWPTAMASDFFEAFCREVERAGIAALPHFLALQAQGANRPKAIVKQMQHLLALRPAAQAPALLVGLDLLRTADLRVALAGLACPVMALLGANDALMPVALGEALQQLKPPMRVDVLPSAAHQAFLSQALDCAEWAAGFFADR